MSLFIPQTLACPGCSKPIAFDVNHSVNADRRPDLRDAVVAGSFQRETCGDCGKSFRLDPELTYLDVAHKQWMLVQPFAKQSAWQALEKKCREAFEQAFGGKKPKAVRAIGKDLQVRIAFGWAAFREKIVAAERALDDATLELVKLTVLRGAGGGPLSDGTEFRLVEADQAELQLAWIDGQAERVVETVTVPRSIYDDIAKDKKGWQALRKELTAGPYVDLNRVLVAGTG